MSRPVIYVLAGVNGAGKSSIGGQMLQQGGAGWFNPDTFARLLMTARGVDQQAANAHAWKESMKRLNAALKSADNYAFETTLGGKSVAAALMQATATHDVIMWYCRLARVELHLERVHARVLAGGHDIPEAKIRERYKSSLLNLMSLMPRLAELSVYDNSVTVAPGEDVPDPVMLLQTQDGAMLVPDSVDASALSRTPQWAIPILHVALTQEAAQRRR